MSDVCCQPRARHKVVAAGRVVRIVTGAGMVATLLACQETHESAATERLTGDTAVVHVTWQPTSQPGTQPAGTRPDPLFW